MTKRKIRNIVTAVSLMAAVSVPLPVYAVTTQEQIDTLQQASTETKTQLVSAQERIAALEAQKGDTQAYLTELNTQLTELSVQQAVLQAQYEQKQEEISWVQEDLEEAREQESKQYEEMKLRIQYIYEKSVNSGMLESLFSAESFTDFLNRADAFGQISQYDREMLNSYADTITDIEENEALLEEEQAEIAQLQEELNQQEADTQEVYESASREFEAIAASLTESESEQAQLVAQIQAQEDTMNQLLAQKYAEEAAAAQAAQAAAAQAASQDAANQAAAAAAAQVTAAQSAAAAAQTAQTTQAAAQDTSAGTVVSQTYLGNFKLTAYCSCSICCGKWAAYAGTTASGAKVQEGVTVAMGGVPFGTKLMINGHVYTVQDRGTAYGHVDIYFNSHQAARNFGMKYADVYQVN